MSQSNRAMLFLDGPNFFYSQRDYNTQHATKVKIDIIKMRDCLVGNRELIASMYFDSLYAGGSIPEPKWRFYDFLTHNGFRLELSNIGSVFVLTPDPQRAGEKGVDVNLAVELVSAAYENLYDVAILVSGDGDYFNAVGKVTRTNHKKVEVVAFKDSCSRSLLEISDIVYLDDMIDTLRQDSEDGANVS